MPINPKQQPPYYTPGTTPTPTENYSRLNEQHAATQTSGTSETDLYLYTIPANTLTNNGDELTIKYAYLISTTGTSMLTLIYINGSAQHAFDVSGSAPKPFYITIQATRISSTQLQTIATLQQTSTTAVSIQTVSTLDFTTTIAFKITGTCGTGVLQTYQLTIDKISN